MNQLTIDMLKRKGVSAIAFVALGALICAESDQFRAFVIQFAAMFGGLSATMSLLSLWLSKQKDNASEARVVLAKLQPPPKEVTPEDIKTLSKVGIEVGVKSDG